jgi:hypothetical protein
MPDGWCLQVSYRSINLKDEPYLMEIVKDKLCYVAADARTEMSKCFPKKNSEVLMEVVLPDGVDNPRGIFRDPRDPRCVPTTTLWAPPCLDLYLISRSAALISRICSVASAW